MLSHVGMANCFYCGEGSKILLDTRLRNKLPMNCGVIDLEPCSKCAEYMKQGIILIGIEPPEDGEIPLHNGLPNPYRTGQFAVVKESAVVDLIPEGEHLTFTLKNRWVFMAKEVMDIILGDKNGKEEVTGS